MDALCILIIKFSHNPLAFFGNKVYNINEIENHLQIIKNYYSLIKKLCKGGMDMSEALVKRRIIRGLVLTALAIVVNMLAGSILI